MGLNFISTAAHFSFSLGGAWRVYEIHLPGMGNASVILNHRQGRRSNAVKYQTERRSNWEIYMFKPLISYT
jgi:hypothetical protein